MKASSGRSIQQEAFSRFSDVLYDEIRQEWHGIRVNEFEWLSPERIYTVASFFVEDIAVDLWQIS
jgi:hypothetical protein